MFEADVIGGMPVPACEDRDLQTSGVGDPFVEFRNDPIAIRNSYQYFTQASVENLRRAGYNGGFTALEDAVRRYQSQAEALKRSAAHPSYFACQSTRAQRFSRAMPTKQATATPYERTVQ